MTLEEIRAEPVGELADQQAHLHLWTTNSFLAEAIDLTADWGFDYKSCFVWVKPELGCGNYWRVSHEFLLLGVRGNLPTKLDGSKQDGAQPQTRCVRMLIEKVSPPPYLEMYGRPEIQIQPGQSTVIKLNAGCLIESCAVNQLPV